MRTNLLAVLKASPCAAEGEPRVWQLRMMR